MFCFSKRASYMHLMAYLLQTWTRAGMFSSCLRSILSFHWEKHEQVWTSRLILCLCISALDYLDHLLIQVKHTQYNLSVCSLGLYAQHKLSQNFDACNRTERSPQFSYSRIPSLKKTLYSCIIDLNPTLKKWTVLLYHCMKMWYNAGNEAPHSKKLT